MSEQLVLPIMQTRNMTFANFYTGPNDNIVGILKGAIEQSKTGTYYIYGKSGIGKTHLLKACFNQQLINLGSASYVSLDIRDLQDDLLSLDPSGLVCIDDLDKIANNRELEEVIFHLYNQVIENNGILVFSSIYSPKNIGVKMPDLVSRLAWGLVYNLIELTEDDVAIVLQGIAKDRDLMMSLEVVNFLLTRCSRNLSDLSNIVDILDKTSFSEQRKLSVPFVKSVLDI